MSAVDNWVRERRADNTRHERGNSDPRLRVTVVFTTAEATIDGLRTAGELASSLAAAMTLLAIEVVPFRLPLGQPSVPVEFLKRQLLALVSEGQECYGDSCPRGSRREFCQEIDMDLVYVLATVAFFIVAIGYVHFCDRVK